MKKPSKKILPKLPVWRVHTTYEQGWVTAPTATTARQVWVEAHGGWGEARPGDSLMDQKRKTEALQVEPVLMETLAFVPQEDPDAPSVKTLLDLVKVYPEMLREPSFLGSSMRKYFE